MSPNGKTGSRPIRLTSRAFATYYFLQAQLAIIYNYKDCPHTVRMTIFNEIPVVSPAAAMAVDLCLT